ncbi:MAG: ZIP family metal transporter [Bacteroidales bacterium]|nr:ZIP family metal transporter [Bacteroidales bacterium]
MDASVLFSYLLIIAGVAVWSILLSGRWHISSRTIQGISVFGGAFLLASCFINLVPHIFDSPTGPCFETSVWHFKLAASVLLGFLIQLVLEHLTRGIEHGHNHCECCGDDANINAHHGHEGHCHEQQSHPILGLMIGLCTHAFLEGMPIVASDGDIHQGLLYGIVIHNIPISIVLVTLFISNHYSPCKAVGLLLLFGLMAPMGSIFNQYFLPADSTLQNIVMGIVVGILLHVSASILFDHDHNHFSWAKLGLIALAFAAAYFTPGCSDIYSSL